MKKLMNDAIDALRRVQPEFQDEIARMIMQLTGSAPPAYELSDKEKADLDEADEEIARGEIATDEEVRAVWAKHGL